MVDNSYEKYIWDEVVLPDSKCDKPVVKFRKRIKYFNISTGEGRYNSTHDKYIYEVEYPDGTTDQLTEFIIAANMLSQVDSAGPNYKVLNEVTDHNRDDRYINKVDCFIKSSNGKIHRKRTARG